MHDLAYVVWGIKPRDVEWARRFCEDDARTVAAGEDLVFHAFAQADGGWVGRIDVHTIDVRACPRRDRLRRRLAPGRPGA